MPQFEAGALMNCSFRPPNTADSRQRSSTSSAQAYGARLATKEARRSMIGGGERAEKIRTYRWKENLVVDHRVDANFNLGEIMDGRMQPLIDKLIERDIAERLAAM